MTDEETPQPQPYFPPPLPEPYAIPRPLIERWMAIGVDDYISVRITRRDVDKLYDAFDKMLQAQWTFQESMIAYTNSNVALANEQFSKSRHMLVESQNAVKAVMTSVMASAAPNK